MDKKTPKLCEHIYTHSEAYICPRCNKDTHKINWPEQHRLHREWIASGKATAQGWWSI